MVWCTLIRLIDWLIDYKMPMVTYQQIAYRVNMSMVCSLVCVG